MDHIGGHQHRAPVLDVFTTIDANSDTVWHACAHFVQHLYWHKSRLVILKQKIEGLPDDRSSKPECLFELSRLFDISKHRDYFFTYLHFSHTYFFHVTFQFIIAFYFSSTFYLLYRDA